MSPCTNRFLRFCFYILIIVDFIKKVVASQATIPPCPPPSCWPTIILQLCQSVCTDFEKFRARQSLCGFWKSCIFSAQKTARRVWRFFYQTVIDSFNRSAIITLVSYCHIRRIHCFVVFRRMMTLKPGCISVSVLFSKAMSQQTVDK